MAHSEKYNLIAKEQYGSRKRKLAIMHAVNKVLSFNIICQYKILAALCCHDAKSCYDWMVHAVTSLAMQSKGVQEPPLVCMFTTLQNLNHTIQTAFGDSESTYGSDCWVVPLPGLARGNKK